MKELNKQALREAAQEEIMLRSVSDTSDAWQDEASPEAVLALLDENLQLQRDKDSLEAVAIAMRDDMWNAREKLEAAERLITEWEQRELSNKRQLVINGLCESGEPFWEIDDYMKKWDAEHPREAAAAGIGVKGE
ncbi:ead/Ea22-like family protein [Citrobacter freundii]|uniref:ead/Ea22-like family protein n=1 Tax=Citrobacter freundii TaxID=546 RepID=UPI00300CBC35